MGAFQGALSSMTAPQLGAVAIAAALERAHVEPAAVQEVFMGNVISAGIGQVFSCCASCCRAATPYRKQAPAKQASLGAGLPTSAPCTQVNKVCASGLKAIMLGAATIQTHLNTVVVAGGMESMSNIPYYLPKARSGLRMGHGSVVDGMLHDGLWDAYHDIHMGECAERCADAHGISRAEQDAHAIESARRATEAQPLFKSREIAPVRVKQRGGEVVVDGDEPVGKFDAARVPTLKPAFRPAGTVTAANASVIADGAAAVVLMSGREAKRRGLRVLGCIRGMADAAQDPVDFPTSPALAVRKLLGAAGLQVADIDCWEVNEAFSVVDLANQKLLTLDPARVNVCGGAVALGHPIGASGARLLVTLLTVLEAKGWRRGVVAICNGGGGASSVLVERIEEESKL